MVGKIKPKIIVVLGPTASGKSALAVELARAFNGEVVSADSRQIYRGLDIGSGKITKTEMNGVSHHLLDIVSPKKMYSVAEFQTVGQAKIADILKRGTVPIICGGTGFYIDSLVESTIFPVVPPNEPLRAMLEKKPVTELCSILEKIDPRRFKEIEKTNSRRLVRAIEIATALGAVPRAKKSKSPYDALYVGTLLPDEVLKKKIHTRLLDRFDQGMIAEVELLHTQGLSWKRLEKFGLEYRAIAQFLKNKKNNAATAAAHHEAMLELMTRLETETWQFSKRQRTWFKRNKKIEWFDPNDLPAIKKRIANFLQNV